MEVDVVINGELAEKAAATDEHQRDHNVDRRPLSNNKIYHVFFCYRDIPNDKLWVKETVNKLENEFGFICCDHERDFLAGTKVIANIKFGIKNSEKVVCVLSKEGLDSEYLRLETEMAHKEGIDKRENLLIPVVLDDCEIPDELKLLTYIDARKEISEKTWWPKLIAAIEAKAECSFFKGRKEEETKEKSENQPRYHFQKLCSLQTTFICTQCSVQSTSKYIPQELASMEAVVPVETIQNIKRDLLDAPRIKCKQQCCCFSIGLLICCAIIWAVVFTFDIAIINGCATTKIISKDDCFLAFGICILIEISVGICCIFVYRCYFKVPKNIDKKIIEYNTELFKKGILITLVYTQLWKNAYIVFYRASFDSCKRYIILHLREDRKTDRETFVNISGIESQHDVDDVPFLTGSGNKDLAQATQTDTFVDTCEMQEQHFAEDVPLLQEPENDQLDLSSETRPCRHDVKLKTGTWVDTSTQEEQIAEDVPLLDLTENDKLDESTEVYAQNVGQRQKDDDEGSAIVNLSDQEHGLQEFTQNSQFPQSSDLINIENVAMALLLQYAHEYLRLVIKDKIKNPKEDRHMVDYTCLCQYIEKRDKKFQKLVDRKKIIHPKDSSIEHRPKMN
ncbi:hypothetical protein ACJMK2_020889 [Sinanodonta woodiana]|uniref:TIR domain-containing protein n=1 Tax=Sinanodonta woodiana TaxID=1069815 RepID=A0ABD3U0J0_SINWO